MQECKAIYNPSRQMMRDIITKINKDIMDTQDVLDKKKKLVQDIEKHIRDIDDLLD